MDTIMGSKKSSGLAMKLGIIGFIAGGVIGFLYRPQALITGQLPFETVITRGANLKGMDQMLMPLAQSSFNNMLVAAVIGAVIGIVVGYMMAKR
jgi:hypothetical protein